MAIVYDIDNLGQALYAKLNAVTALSGKVNPMRIPEGTAWPACSYYIISTIPEESKDDGSVMDLVRVQISLFAETYNSVCSIADSVRVALVGTTGETNSTTIDTVRLVDETDMFEDDIKIYHRAQDYLVRVVNKLSVSPTSVTFTGTGVAGDTVQTVAVHSHQSWTATDDAAWLSVTASGTGGGTLTATATVNGTGHIRTATITLVFSGGQIITIPVTQQIPIA